MGSHLRGRESGNHGRGARAETADTGRRKRRGTLDATGNGVTGINAPDR